MDKKENFWTKDFVDPKKLHIAILVVVGAIALWILSIAIQGVVDVHQTLSRKAVKNNQQTHGLLLESGDLRLSTMDVTSNDDLGKSLSNLYVTLTNISSSVPESQRQVVISSMSSDEKPIYGLRGSPSFIVHSSDLSFWRWQFYFQIIFRWGGYLIFLALTMAALNIKFKYHKAFITPFKNVIFGLGFLFMSGAFIKWGLSAYLISFLRNHYDSVKLTAQSPTMLFYLGIAIVFLGFLLEDAVHLQKEQDLTI